MVLAAQLGLRRHGLENVQPWEIPDAADQIAFPERSPFVRQKVRVKKKLLATGAVGAIGMLTIVALMII